MSKKRQYDEEFKENVVKRSYTSNKSVVEVAEKRKKQYLVPVANEIYPDGDKSSDDFL